MKSKQTSSTPEGYSTICPYLIVDDVDAEMAFLITVFDAEIIERLRTPDGSVMHGEARIGNAVVMLGMTRPDYPVLESMNYVFVDDVDATHERALRHGAQALMEPTDQFYGNREAGFKDPQGNQWWVARQNEQLSAEVMEKRMADQIQ